MQQKRHRLIYGLSVRRCEVYRSRRRFSGRIVSCWKPVYWRGWVRGRGQRGHFEGRARWFSRDFTCSHPPILSRALCSHWCFPPPISSQKLLFSLGGSFLYYADHFKLYSGFCANHIKVQKVLERGTTHILIFCIVTRNSMQKQTKFSFRAPVLRQRKLGRSRLKVRSSLLGSKSIMYESKCPRVRRWVKARWAMPLQFSTSPAPSPAPRTKEHTALHLSVCDRHFQSIIALFSSNRWCLNKYMHI